MRPRHCTFGYDMSQRLWVLSDDDAEVQLGAFATRSSACARQLIADLVRAGARVRLRDSDGRYLAGDARADWMDHPAHGIGMRDRHARLMRAK